MAFGPADVAAPRDQAHSQPLAEVDTVDTKRITPAGYGFDATGRHRRSERRLRELEDRYHHELVDDEEREELRERISRLRRA